MSTFRDELRAAFATWWYSQIHDDTNPGGGDIAEWAARFALERAARECMEIARQEAHVPKRMKTMALDADERQDAAEQCEQRIRALAATLAAKED